MCMVPMTEWQVKSALGAWPFGAGTGGVPGSIGQTLDLSVIICLEKLFYKIFFLWFWYDFVMVLLWFPYGWFYVFFACPQNSYDFDMVLLWSWSASFFLMKFVMAGRIFFVKKYLVIVYLFSHFRIEKQ